MVIYEILVVGAASSRDSAISYNATFFRGWKPLPREIDVNLMTLTSDLLKLYIRFTAIKKIPNNWRLILFEIWILYFGVYLSFGACYLLFLSEPEAGLSGLGCCDLKTV